MRMSTMQEASPIVRKMFALEKNFPGPDLGGSRGREKVCCYSCGDTKVYSRLESTNINLGGTFLQCPLSPRGAGTE